MIKYDVDEINYEIPTSKYELQHNIYILASYYNGSCYNNFIGFRS